LIKTIAGVSVGIIAISFAAIFIRLCDDVPSLMIATYRLTLSSIILLCIAKGRGIPFTGYKASSYFYMVLLAVVPQLIGHTAINWALKHLKTSMVAITILGEPIGASILAYVIFHEKIGSFQGVGIVLIFLTIIVASRKGKK